MPIYTSVSLAPDCRPVQLHTGENTAALDSARHRTDADRPEFFARLVGRGVPYRNDDRHHRLLLRPDGGRLGDSGRRHQPLGFAASLVL